MNHLWQALMIVRRCNRRSFRLRLLYVLLQSLLPLASLYILKLLIDSITLAATTHSHLSFLSFLNSPFALLVAMVGLFLLGRIVSALSAINNDVLSQRLVDYMTALMQNHAASLDYAYFDNPAFHDTLHRAQQEAGSRPLQILNSFMGLFGAIISTAGVVAMLASATPWVIAVMILAVLPSFIVRLYKARSIYNFRRSNTQLYRQTAYYGSVLTSRTYAAELRAFRLAPIFRRLFSERRHTLVQTLLRISRRLGTLDILCALVEAAVMFAIILLLIRQALAAAITVGTFVMLFEAFRRGQGYLSSLVASVASLYDNRLFASNLFEFLNLRPHILPPDDPQPIPDIITTVELRDVTFRYPGTDRDVLSHFNLTCRRGEITHIEGQNGFGKTTILCLILRLYDPDQGAVLINGIDIRRFRPDDLRAAAGVLFQDFARYAATVRENIHMSVVSTQRSVSKDATQDDVSPLTTLIYFVDKLPQGLDTPLGRIFDGGQELSMGQWQRLALTRALATDAPILLLDEPLAWMDQPTRETFLAHLDQIKHNRIVILINHI